MERMDGQTSHVETGGVKPAEFSSSLDTTILTSSLPLQHSTFDIAANGIFTVNATTPQHVNETIRQQQSETSPLRNGETVSRDYTQARIAQRITGTESPHFTNPDESQQSEPERIQQQQQSTVNEFERNQRNIPAQHVVPGSDMGYTNTIDTFSRSSPASSSTKMERTPSLHSSSSEKDTSDGHSVDSIIRGVLGEPAESPSTPERTTRTVGDAGQAFGTPSTISTAPSTDEASVDDESGLDRSTWRLDGGDVFNASFLLPRQPVIQSIPARDSAMTARMPSPETAAVRSSEESNQHRRSRSWEEQQQRDRARGTGWEDTSAGYAGHNAPHGSLGREQVGPSQSRVASFRTQAAAPAAAQHPYAAPQSAPLPESWRQGARLPEPRPSHGHQQQMRVDGRSVPPYQQQQAGYAGPRSPGYGQPMGSHTPPRSKQPRSPLHTFSSRSTILPSTPVSGPPHSGGLNPPRSSSEVLKTLLRKKACLYEPDTSRAIAYVTWLVGRELALEYGYFSRQQLQSGVHACVAKKIDSGTITRTKVNRCMQIILNSCFHYIIPRPDGSEEKGGAFRDEFAAQAVDDSRDLESLPAPWHDLVVNREFVLSAFSGETTSPTDSPRLASQQSKATSVDDGQSKRSVLLCFNENVRSAADVFRCHNEFIRDTANAANLQLSAQEWRAFFGRDTTKTTTTTTAWASAGMSTAVARAEGDIMKRPDVLGRMSADELSRFRTTWCGKRYEHDHDLCAFAHVEVNGGWLRRNPLTKQYRAEMCPSVVGVADKRISPYSFVVNQCEKGEECDFAHSKEEIAYHPDRYKRKVCASSARGGTCPLGDICPNFHTSDTVAQGKRRASPERRHGSRTYRQSHGSGGKVPTGLPPEGSPMLYISPAPVSSYEKQLGVPGLQSLFRRHSAVVGGYLRYGEQSRCCYANFGDDWGITGPTNSHSSNTPRRGLPSVPSRT